MFPPRKQKMLLQKRLMVRKQEMQELQELHTPRRKVERLPTVKARVPSPVDSVAKVAASLSTPIMVGNNITRQNTMASDTFAVC